MRTIVAAVDGSEASVRAAQLGAELAARFQATLVLAFVETQPLFPPDAGAAAEVDVAGASGLAARRMLEAVREALPVQPSVVELRVLQGNPADAITAYARRTDAWMIVVGGCARSGISRLVTGTTGDTLVRQCHVPVLVVP